MSDASGPVSIREREPRQLTSVNPNQIRPEIVIEVPQHLSRSPCDLERLVVILHCVGPHVPEFIAPSCGNPLSAAW